MRLLVEFSGRKRGSIGIFYSIGTWTGVGETLAEAICNAGEQAQAEGFETYTPKQIEQLDGEPSEDLKNLRVHADPMTGRFRNL
jgi:hypothetical protein